MKKQIAIFSPHSDPLARLGGRECGGQNLYVRSLIQQLDRLGWQVDAFTRLNDHEKRHIARIGSRSRVIRLRGGPIGHIPKGKLHPYFPELWENFLVFSREQSNNTCPYALFHGHHYDGGFMALKAHELWGNPLVMTYHSLGVIRMKTQEQFQNKIDDEWVFKERLGMEQEQANCASLIISLSESEKSDLVAYYGVDPAKVRVVPGGVNLRQFRHIVKEKARRRARYGPDDFMMIFVGRLEWRKGVATLLHALRIVAKDIPQAKLLVVGGRIFGKKANADDVKEYGRLCMIADKIGVADRVRFAGSVSHHELPQFMSAADALVIPSYYESFGLVALEGLASGIPVIASRTGGLMATIQDGRNGLLFAPRNPPALAEKILALYHSPEFAAKLARQGKEDIKRYSWEHIISEIAPLYESLIEAKIEDRVGSPV